MNPGTMSILPLIASAIASACAAIVAVVITNWLSKRREHEADWRKLKFSQYQEFVLALSGIVNDRSTRESQARYSDAVNSMALIAPMKVLEALTQFQAEISYVNKNRNQETHDRLLDPLLRAMRADIQPHHSSERRGYTFKLLGLPPRETQA
jgi:hypothetical protein